MLLRDKCWLWGHQEGAFNNSEAYKHFTASRMTPMECCCYLGIRNTFMVPVDTPEVNPNPNRRQYNKSFTTLNKVGWECFASGLDPEKIEPFIQEAKDFPNINCIVFDDFQRHGKYKEVPIENLWKVRDRLHHNDVRRLDMWMVLYTYEFGEDPEKDEDFKRYIEPFDGVIMWTWTGSLISKIPEKYELFKELTKDKRRMFGCYLYDFGGACQVPADVVTWQLDWYREKLLAGEGEGIVFHTNTMADLDYESYDAAIAWMKKHGDDVMPD